MSLLSKLIKRKPKETWYPNPFEEGKTYRVTQNIFGVFDKIEKGTELTYFRTAHSPYDGCIGFFFKDTEGTVRTWDLEEDWDPIARARDYFTEIEHKTEPGAGGNG